MLQTTTLAVPVDQAYGPPTLKISWAEIDFWGPLVETLQ